MLGKSFLAGFIRPITGPDPATRDRLRRLGKTLQTGDLVLFAGKGWLSGIIRLFTRSHWTHVGVVVRPRGWSEPMVLEASGMSEVVDQLSGKKVPGVTLACFHTRVAEYDGDVAIRRRNGRTLSPARERLFHRLAARFHLRPYKNFLWSLFLDMVCGMERHQGFPSVFCSELVAELYRRVGWLAPEARTSRFVPGDFAGEGAGYGRVCEHMASIEVIKSSAAPSPDTVATDHRTAAHGKLPRRQ